MLPYFCHDFPSPKTPDHRLCGQKNDTFSGLSPQAKGEAYTHGFLTAVCVCGVGVILKHSKMEI